MDPEAINDVVNKMVEVSNERSRKAIESAKPNEVKEFFEDMTVKEADLNFWLKAMEKVKPTAPTQPTLPEVEYASKVMRNLEMFHRQKAKI